MDSNKQVGSWWCCDANYPNHDTSCKNALSPPADHVCTQWNADGFCDTGEISTSCGLLRCDGSPPADTVERAREIVNIVLGFNNLDDLGTLSPDHANRKHVVSVVADRISAALVEKDAEIERLSNLAGEWELRYDAALEAARTSEKGTHEPNA